MTIYTFLLILIIISAQVLKHGWKLCIHIYSTDPIGFFICPGFFLYKSKENCLTLKTEGLKIRIQNKRLKPFIKNE